MELVNRFYLLELYDLGFDYYFIEKKGYKSLKEAEEELFKRGYKIVEDDYKNLKASMSPYIESTGKLYYLDSDNVKYNIREKSYRILVMEL